ncbi:maleylpyruvate isomerase N-terminal domain-containing protein [Thalassovita taeanensis]|uniref:Maleylpyruvate isomerase n=1 Tax=Thalassovita taeanensis TaxID=657014 RepID=A0A1H9IXU3_9RHOB|nr:maleylpyruvate isomerase N-terminal domain-containing protein [Thalassovita taeanensis]SEQ79352.1 maleylpyruvate isomerase [Thalassovita taeanensis]
MPPGASKQAALDLLKERQGKGARYDAPDAPGADLLLARRGTAFFARKLNELSDSDLDKPSLCDGWSRRHVIADICFSARAQAIALKKLREPLTLEEETWTPDLALGITLPPHALRHLFDHTAIHLNVEYRDLTNDDWQRSLALGPDSALPVRELPIRRAQEIWLAAYHLAVDVRLLDLPDFQKRTNS